MRKTIIKLDNVWKTYKMGHVNINALAGINIDIKENEFIAVVGPSGSGKSTCMNLIGCLDIPTRGKIYLEQHDISKLPESTLAQIRGKKIGFVFQAFNLIPTLTALENVMLPMTFQSVPREARLNKARDLLIKLGLKDRLNNLPSQLSGGESQRVAIARSLANDPEIILADKPTGNLDTKTGTEIMELLTNLHEKENRTIAMVTHDVSLKRHADRIIYIKDGKNLRGV